MTLSFARPARRGGPTEPVPGGVTQPAATLRQHAPEPTQTRTTPGGRALPAFPCGQRPGTRGPVTHQARQRPADGSTDRPDPSSTPVDNPVHDVWSTLV